MGPTHLESARAALAHNEGRFVLRSEKLLHSSDCSTRSRNRIDSKNHRTTHHCFPEDRIMQVIFYL